MKEVSSELVQTTQKQCSKNICMCVYMCASWPTLEICCCLLTTCQNNIFKCLNKIKIKPITKEGKFIELVTYFIKHDVICVFLINRINKKTFNLIKLHFMF